MRQWLKRLWCVLWTCVPDATKIRPVSSILTRDRRMYWTHCLRCGHAVFLRKVTEGLYEVKPR